MAITKGMTVIAAAALISGSALAKDAAFENHLQSKPIVSPAQLYQVDQSKSDFSLGYASSKLSTDNDDTGKTTSSETGTELFAAGIFNVKSIDLRAGMSVDYITGSTEDKNDAGKAEGDATWMVFTPQAAMPIGPVVVGAAFDLVQETKKVEDADEAKANYNTFRPGVLFANKDLEAGITYVSPHNSPAIDEDKELPVVKPAEVTLHGRYALDRDFALGAILTNNDYSAINDDTQKDQTELTVTSEYTAGAIKVEGDLGYNSAYYKDTENITPLNIATMELGAGADYAVNKDAAVGGALTYEFGSETSKGTDYAVNDLGFAIRGNVQF
jgi:hypothetical protein